MAQSLENPPALLDNADTLNTETTAQVHSSWRTSLPRIWCHHTVFCSFPLPVTQGRWWSTVTTSCVTRSVCSVRISVASIQETSRGQEGAQYLNWAELRAKDKRKVLDLCKLDTVRFIFGRDSLWRSRSSLEVLSSRNSPKSPFDSQLYLTLVSLFPCPRERQKLPQVKPILHRWKDGREKNI